MQLTHQHQQEPLLSSALQLTPDYRERLTTGRDYQPPFSPEFPAQRITTNYAWDELVLDQKTRREVEDIITWTRHQDSLLNDWMLKKRLKSGCNEL